MTKPDHTHALLSLALTFFSIVFLLLIYFVVADLSHDVQQIIDWLGPDIAYRTGETVGQLVP